MSNVLFTNVSAPTTLGLRLEDGEVLPVSLVPQSGVVVTWANDLAGSTDAGQFVAGISGNAGGGGAVALGATVVLTAAAGAGGLALGNWIGNTTLPTGNLSWTGAGGSAATLVSGTSIVLGTGGAGARTWTLDNTGQISLDASAAPTNWFTQTALANIAGAGAAGATGVILGQAGQTSTAVAGGQGGPVVVAGGKGGGSAGGANNANGGDVITGLGAVGTGGGGTAGLNGFWRVRSGVGGADRMISDWSRTTANIFTMQGQQAMDVTTTAGALRMNGAGGTELLNNGTLAFDAGVTNANALTASAPIWGTTGGLPQGVATSALATGTFTPATGAPFIALTGGPLSGNLTVALANAQGSWEIDCSGITLNGHSLIITSGSATLTYTAFAVASKSTIVVTSRGGNTIGSGSPGTFT